MQAGGVTMADAGGRGHATSARYTSAAQAPGGGGGGLFPLAIIIIVVLILSL